MQINNLGYNVPSQVRQLLYSVVPFGSEYVCFTSAYSQASQTYDILFKKIGSKQLYHYQVVHTGGTTNSYVLSEVSSSDQYDGFTVSDPYYCYSSIPSQGILEKLPSTDNLICFMLIVLASLAVLRTVFGGIKLWKNRKRLSV